MFKKVVKKAQNLWIMLVAAIVTAYNIARDVFLGIWQAVLLFIGMGMTSITYAALDPAVTTAYTTIQTDGEDLLGLAWPVITFFTAAFIIIKLFKRSSNKV